jgi:hypothetical protein
MRDRKRGRKQKRAKRKPCGCATKAQEKLQRATRRRTTWHHHMQRMAHQRTFLPRHQEVHHRGRDWTPPARESGTKKHDAEEEAQPQTMQRHQQQQPQKTRSERQASGLINKHDKSEQKEQRLSSSQKNVHRAAQRFTARSLLALDLHKRFACMVPRARLFLTCWTDLVAWLPQVHHRHCRHHRSWPQEQPLLCEALGRLMPCVVWRHDRVWRAGRQQEHRCLPAE